MPFCGNDNRALTEEPGMKGPPFDWGSMWHIITSNESLKPDTITTMSLKGARRYILLIGVISGSSKLRPKRLGCWTRCRCPFRRLRPVSLLIDSRVRTIDFLVQLPSRWTRCPKIKFFEVPRAKRENRSRRQRVQVVRLLCRMAPSPPPPSKNWALCMFFKTLTFISEIHPLWSSISSWQQFVPLQAASRRPLFLFLCMATRCTVKKS